MNDKIKEGLPFQKSYEELKAENEALRLENEHLKICLNDMEDIILEAIKNII